MNKSAFDTIAEQVAEAIKTKGAIVIGVNADNTIVVCSTTNLNHQAVVGHLAVSIHAVLSDHDARIMAGEAGEAVRDLFSNLANGAH